MVKEQCAHVSHIEYKPRHGAPAKPGLSVVPFSVHLWCLENERKNTILIVENFDSVSFSE